MTYTLDAYNRENFYGIYREFCESLIKGVVQKNSSTYSTSYINRVSTEISNNTNNNAEVTSLQGTTDSNGNIGFQQIPQITLGVDQGYQQMNQN